MISKEIINIFSAANRREPTRTIGRYQSTSSRFISVFFLCFILSCSAQKLVVQELAIERDGIEIALVKAEIAQTQEERNKGLMYRKELPDGEGMLFIYERDEVMSFWMKNTRIPLSIAFIASDGRIVEIKNMYPYDENPVHSSRSLRFALEVPQGWFSRAGVQSGDVVKIPR
jgi:uncharacterized membrane protein (UPF0127 family)